MFLELMLPYQECLFSDMHCLLYTQNLPLPVQTFPRIWKQLTLTSLPPTEVCSEKQDAPEEKLELHVMFIPVHVDLHTQMCALLLCNNCLSNVQINYNCNIFVLRFISNVLQTSSFVKFVWVEPREPLNILQTYYGSKVHKKQAL